jgi:type IV secretion system protein VirB3
MIPEEPIYKGATRPPTFLGVPLAAFIGVAGGGFLLGIYALVLASIVWASAVIVPSVAILAWCRAVSRKDDQRLGQMAVAANLALRCRNRRLWGARSYSPVALRGARDGRRR